METITKLGTLKFNDGTFRKSLKTNRIVGFYQAEAETFEGNVYYFYVELQAVTSQPSGENYWVVDVSLEEGGITGKRRLSTYGEPSDEEVKELTKRIAHEIIEQSIEVDEILVRSN